MTDKHTWTKTEAAFQVEQECSIKITIEFSRKTTGDRNLVSVSEMKKFIADTLDSSPDHPLAYLLNLYDDALKSEHSILKDESLTPPKITLGFGDCGGCPMPTGGPGRQCYSTECGIHDCLRC